MGRSKSSNMGLMIYDVLVMALCFIVASSIVLGSGKTSLSQFLTIEVSIGSIVGFFALVFLWHIVLSTMRVYGPTQLAYAFHYTTSETLRVLRASAIATVAIISLSLIFGLQIVNAKFVLSFWLSVTACMLLARFAQREVSRLITHREDRQRKLLIVGANTRSLKLAQQIAANPQLGYQVLGFVDKTSQHAADFNQTGFSLVADFDDLPDYLRDNAMDEVIVCLPVRSRYDDIQNISKLCEDQGIMVGMLPDLIPLNPLFSGLQQFGDQTIMTVSPHGIRGLQAAAKRLMDIVLAGSLLILLTPVLLIIVMLIKITSPGPVFFQQERLGLNKKRFHMIKFRSMVTDAEARMAEVEVLNEAEGPVFKIKDDPRITKVGKFLRKSSLDELPQLINVLRGEMSLVGPRPLTVRDYQGFNEDWHRRRFSIRPGITGLWQVSGRCDIPFEQWMQLDMQYIDQWSLFLDLKVLLLTVPAVVSGDGAE